MTTKRKVGWGALPGALWAALQWRVMLIWVVLMALPTAIATLPVGRALGALLDHSLQSTALAHEFNGLFMGDALALMARHNGAVIHGTQILGVVVTLLLSPFLTGVVLTAVRASRHPRLGELMHGGLRQYWRMLRLMLWSLVPYAIAVFVGMTAYDFAQTRAHAATLESVADNGFLAARIILVVLLVLAHVIMECSRACVAADEHLLSATRAFGRGMAMLARRPLVTLGLYLGTSIIGYALAGLVGILRIRVDAVGVVGLAAAIVLAQLIVIILAWQRTARIGALVMVARATSRSRAGGIPLARV